MVDIVFLDPVADHCDREIELLESLHLAELEAYLQKHGYTTYRVNARQNNLSALDAVSEAMAQKPCCVSVWVQYRSLKYCLQFLKELNGLAMKNRPFIVAEGNVATFSARQLLRNLNYQLDAVMLGDVIDTTLKIVQTVKDYDDWREVPGIVFRNSLNELE